MKRHFGLFIVIVLLSLLLIPPLAAQENGPAQVGLRPDAPTYALHGPYWVGTMDVVIGEGTENPLPASIWYPALNPENLPETIVYPIEIQFMPIPEDIEQVNLGHALLNAAPDPGAAPYPLIVFSHGFTGFSHLYTDIIEHLASYGFVVIAPEHLNEEWPVFYANVVKRLVEVTRAINFADSLTVGTPEFAGLIDTERIAVVGHSAGGITSYGAGGAGINMDAIREYCRQFSENDECSLLQTSLEAEMLSAAGWETAPSGLWTIQDPRVDAIVPMSGTIEPYGQEGLAMVTVPALFMYGSADWLGMAVPDQLNDWMMPGYGFIGSTQKARVMFMEGGHTIFMNPAENSPWMSQLGIFIEDPVWDTHRSIDLANHFTTAFLLSVLYADADATAALSPDAVSFTGITYEATGF